MDARLILDGPAPGAWNMALDEALLEWTTQTGETCLRFYQWSPATLSLGYFQACHARAEHAASGVLPVVRRASGGGAIVHDHELTYSLVTPTTRPLARTSLGLVQDLHATLIAALKSQSVTARFCKYPLRVPREQQPFLCFLRRAAEDLLVGPHKIAGSAQRRNHGAILQHGSLLLGRSRHAPDLPGIQEASGVTVSLEPLRSAWLDQIRQRLGWSLSTFQPPERVLERAAWWQANRFAASSWTRKR